MVVSSSPFVSNKAFCAFRLLLLASPGLAGARRGLSNIRTHCYFQFRPFLEAQCGTSLHMVHLRGGASTPASSTVRFWHVIHVDVSFILAEERHASASAVQRAALYLIVIETFVPYEQGMSTTLHR